MSDFDKEKERERLREKYEREQEKRETAEKMSELLLQGATMTNAHCSECGDPIFRYDGQEFCATCEKPVDRGTDDEGDDDEEDAEAGEKDDGTAEDSETIEVTSPSDDARVQFGGEADGTDPDEHGTDDTVKEPTPQTDVGRAPDDAQSSGPNRQRPPERPTGEPPAEADVSAARDSLVRSLSRFSQRAEQCEDPQRATGYLAAAREAAEALAALRR
jgi:uncharacterized Zn finger protein (UPF0148 family)